MSSEDFFLGLFALALYTFNTYTGFKSVRKLTQLPLKNLKLIEN